MASPPEKAISPVVGLLYDDRMCLHATPDGESHPENPERLRSIWRKLSSEGITGRCVVLKAKEAKEKDIAAVHNKEHIKLIRNISSNAYDIKRNKIARKFNSIYFNKGSSESAFLAAGSVIDVAEKVARGEMNSAIALVRPPGHHAEHGEAMGFCLFNNVAIAASYLLNEQHELGIRKVLVVDWDVHHGNGTQNMFYKDPRVLFFSVHRFDYGNFYPAGSEGAHFMIGDEAGLGYNINVPWEHGLCGDADYLAVWDHVLLPVANNFNPDIVLISAGFDAAMGDPLGGCCVTPDGYAELLKKIEGFAQGKIVMVLEGGYNLNSIANSVFACAKVLLGDELSFKAKQQKPFISTWRVIKQVRAELKSYWPVLAEELSDAVTSEARQFLEHEVSYSSEDDDKDGLMPSSSILAIYDSNGTLESGLAKLGIYEDDHFSAACSNQISTIQSQVDMVEPNNVNPDISEKMPNAPWRSELRKKYVWYASFGSNMWKPRFLCYIEGGQVEDMATACCGSRDKRFPEDIKWKVVPHRLFFGRSFTPFWGAGGTAFLNPVSNEGEKSHICMYKITLEQFNDILFQENSNVGDNSVGTIRSPFIDITHLDLLSVNKSLHVEAFKGGWYSNILQLGEDDGIPILTMTCSASDVERFKSGEVPLRHPSESYSRTLLRGLMEGIQLSAEAAAEYLNGAATRSL